MKTKSLYSCAITFANGDYISWSRLYTNHHYANRAVLKIANNRAKKNNTEWQSSTSQRVS